jgi:DNA repair photolyase
MKIMRHMCDCPEFSHLGEDFFKVMKYYRDYGKHFQYGSLEHYDKCSYRCVYCITESQGKTRAKFSRTELLSSLEKELSLLSEKWVICMGAAMDPYNEIEPDLRLTRDALELVKKYNLRFTITTKGVSILNDIDFFRRFYIENKNTWFKLIISLSVLNPKLEKKIEPGAPSTSDRIKTLAALQDEGFPEVWASISPWIPEITNLEEILDQLPDGMPVVIQPLEIGDEFEEPLDFKRTMYSANLAFGSRWTSQQINKLYIEQYHQLSAQYRKKFPRMEWRLPILKETHSNDSGYLNEL